MAGFVCWAQLVRAGPTWPPSKKAAWPTDSQINPLNVYFVSLLAPPTKALLTHLTTHPTLPYPIHRDESTPYVTLLWDPMVFIFVNYVDGRNVCFRSWFLGEGGGGWWE
jgi:hypothetical protein